MESKRPLILRQAHQSKLPAAPLTTTPPSGQGNYTSAQLEAINRAAFQPLVDADWKTFDEWAVAYRAKIPELTKAQSDTLTRLSKRLAREIGYSSRVETSEVTRFKKALGEIEMWARAHYVLRKGHREQPAQDSFIIEAVSFYRRAGGHAGTAMDSPCANFVTAVVAPVVAAATGGNLKGVAHVIRTRLILVAAHLETEPPDFDGPTLVVE
jgi:hypothetical protein